MHKRNLFFVAAALGSASLVSSFTGCSSSSGSPASPDSGTESDTGTVADSGTTEDSSTPVEASTADTGTTPPATDGGDASVATLDCTKGTGPTGTPILASNTASVQNVTADGQVLFYDSSAKTLNSVPIAGGTPVSISPYDNSGLYVSGKVAVWSHGAAPATGATAPYIGPLLTSVSGAASKTLSLAAYQSTIGGGYVDISFDGNYALYTTNAAAKTADIVVSAPDGTNPVTLVTGAVYNGTDCDPQIHFVPGTDTAVVAYCTTSPVDATALTNTITAYSGAGFATTKTFTTSGFFGYSFDKPAGSTPATQIAFTTKRRPVRAVAHRRHARR